MKVRQINYYINIARVICNRCSKDKNSKKKSTNYYNNIKCSSNKNEPNNTIDSNFISNQFQNKYNQLQYQNKQITNNTIINQICNTKPLPVNSFEKGNNYIKKSNFN